METRNQAFQRLKPICVGLSQTTLALQSTRGNISDLTTRLESLQDAVATVAKSDQLDEKLADYVFFPLSQVLKLSQRVSVRCLELTLSVLAVLVQQGWRHRVQPQLAAQMLILCTLLASDKPTGLASSGTTVELRTNALQILKGLFDALGASKAGKELLQSESNTPQLGQTLSTSLDAILDAEDPAVQSAAVDALNALIRSLDDRETMARFLPGTVSKLTKVLTPKTKQRRNHYVLTGCLETVCELLSSILSDDAASDCRPQELSVGASVAMSRNSVIDAAWLEAAATQMKPALVSISRLRDSAREDVRTTLAQLFMTVLEQCSQPLANCASLALDTLVTLCTKSASKATQRKIEVLISTNPAKSALLEELLHDWLQSLSRILQSSNEDLKTECLQKITISYDILVRCSLPTQSISSELTHALRDSMIVTLQPSRPQAQVTGAIESIQSLDLSVMASDRSTIYFGPVLAKYRRQQEIISGIETLIESMSCSSTSSSALAEITRSLRLSQGDAQIVNLWLLYVSVRATVQQGGNLGDMINGGDEHNAMAQDALEELYDFSLSVLGESSSEMPPDSRMQALALRALALRAETAGKEFRYELIDALYPVLHTLATPDAQLQQDSITTLNIFTQACAYSSTQDLIVENVDYLTNAVALKLNAFDVSPQAPQVLLMMVRLAGPSLLPYLEDTIDSIFAALEDFHGYPLLVELLFRVLSVVAEEGAKAPQLAIASGPVSEVLSHGDARMKPIDTTGLAELLREKAKNDAARMEASDQDSERHSFPQKPWKTDTERQETQDDDEEMSESGGQVSDETPPPPAPKTYNLLLKITELTQHFLPSASPSLRTSLLSMIHTTAPALAKHENSFLPLINTLWPEVTARLDDSEANVQATALHIIADLCVNAKDFMRSRIVEIWPILVEVHQRLSMEIVSSSTSRQHKDQRASSKTSQALIKDAKSFKQAVMRMQAAPADYSNTSLRLLWDALVNVITTAVRYVALPPEKIDEALEMLAPVLGLEDVRDAFQAENADALWLMDVRNGLRLETTKPPVPLGQTWEWAALPG